MKRFTALLMACIVLIIGVNYAGAYTYKTTDSYGPAEVDIYMPYWSPKPWPTVFSIHGGGWTIGDKSEGPSLDEALELVDEGYMVVSINYRLVPGHTWPYQLLDTFEAVDYILNKYASRIGTYGFIGASAGAQIAAMAVNLKYHVPSVLLYGPYDLNQWAIQNPDIAALYLYPTFGANPSPNESPINRIPANPSPTFMIHSTEDQACNYMQTVVYRQALSDAGGIATAYYVTGNHGTDTGSPAERIIMSQKILTFFNLYLK